MADGLVPAGDEISLRLLTSEKLQDLQCLSATGTSTRAVSQEPMRSHEQAASGVFGSLQQCLPPDLTQLCL